MNFVCEHCKGVDHNEKPVKCRAGTWCDCLHRKIVIIDPTNGASNDK